jgi:ABC-type multidrug transport system fused ATPase/permease subunit
MATSVLLVLMSFCLLALAWYWRKQPRLHIPAMIVVIMFDVFFPVYLYLTHDWWKRLIGQGEIFSFLIWAHLIFIIVLYTLYGLQVIAGRAMLIKHSAEQYQRLREEHKKQFIGIVVARLFVFLTGSLLIVPAATG